jgi:hypothetical protein
MHSVITRTGTTYPNVAPEFISDIRTGMTYPNVAPEFIAHIRTGTTYLNIAISQLNSGATLG